MYRTNIFYTVITVFLIDTISNVNGVKSIPCSTNGDFKKRYDSSKYQCCAGKLELLQHGKRCCYEAKEFYFEGESVCCNGKVTDKPPGVTSMSCCNNKLIDDSTHICCNGHIKLLPADLLRDNAACCGSIIYNVTEKFCCENNPQTLSKKNALVGCCGATLYDKASNWCDQENHIKRKYIMLCGGKDIDLLEQSCCANVPNNQPMFKLGQRIDHVDCCLTKPMNSSSETCCPSGNIIPKHPDLDCCGQGFYNISTHLCCKGEIISRVKGDNQCCGTKSYNTDISGCCRHNIYNRQHQQCCGGKIYNITQTCCGGELLNKDNICCDDVIQINKDEPEDNKCCFNRRHLTGNSYNIQKKGCHRGHIYTLGHQEPCGLRFIDPKESICCFHKAHYKTPGVTLKCCGREAYDVDDNICCGSSVFRIPPKYGKCCKGKGYYMNDLPEECPKEDEKKEIEEYSLTPAPTVASCEGLKYDTKSFICSHGRLISKTTGTITKTKSKRTPGKFEHSNIQSSNPTESKAVRNTFSILLITFYVLTCILQYIN